MIEGVQSFNDLVALWATYAVAALALVGASTLLNVALKWIQSLSEQASELDEADHYIRDLDDWNRDTRRRDGKW